MLNKFILKHFPNSLWASFLKKEKLKSIVVIIIGIIFFLLTYFLVAKPTILSKNNSKKSYLEIKSILSNHNYNFRFICNGEVYYEGVRLNNKIKGFKYENDQIINGFYIDDNIVYLIDGENVIEYDEELDKITFDNFFDIDYVLSYIDASTLIENLTFKNLYGYVKITYKDDSIMIEIDHDSDYLLVFDNLNLITENNF